MHSITLVTTAHKHIGECNSRELYKIIEEFKPEIIFEELSPATHDDCYILNSFGLTKIRTLETDAIKTYKQYNNVMHLPMLTAEMHKDFHRMHDKVQDYNYREMIIKLNSFERTRGFPFLNSKECEHLFQALKEHEKFILNDDDYFLSAYQHVDVYENDMIENIYKFSAQNKYTKALMFIGAAHRKSIIQKVQDYNMKSTLKLNWTFYGNQV